MSTKLLGIAALIGFSAVFAVACRSSKDDDGAPAQPDSTDIGPFEDGGTTPADGGTIPGFHFDDASSDDGGDGASADAGPDITPVDNDPGASKGALLFGTDSAGRLVSFRENAADTVGVKLVTGLAGGEVLLNVTFRPSNGLLYGLGSGSHVYVIDVSTGVATIVGDGKGFQPFLAAQADGFDFNPVTDQIRVQTDVDQDLRLDPTTAKVTAIDGTLAFATGDVNFGQSPNLVGTAYTNSVTPAPSTTMLYALDSTRNLLTKLPDEDDGMVETVGDLGIDFDAASGFDIAKTGIAYAALYVDGELGLYTIDLTLAKATKKGVIGYPVALTSIAVQP